jgi:hypothetical protein
VRVSRPSARQQDDRDPNLRDNEATLQPLTAQTAAHTAHALCDPCAELSLSRQAWRIGEQDSHRHRHGDREREHHPIQANLIGARRIPLGQRDQQPEAQARQHQSERGTGERQHQVLDQQQPTKPRHARA